MSNVMSLSSRRKAMIRHHGAGSPEAIAADIAWRRGRVLHAIEVTYAGRAIDDPIVTALLDLLAGPDEEIPS